MSPTRADPHAQVFLLIDTVLGVQHGPKLAGFQADMRNYIPGAHRRMLGEVEAAVAALGSLRDGAAAAGAGSDLAAAHSAALASLAGLRAYHMGVATHYLRAALKVEPPYKMGPLR